jgi:hypothetical protein
MDKITSMPHSAAVKNRAKKSIYAWLTGSTLIVLLTAFLVLNGRISTASSHEITQSFPVAYDATGAMLNAVVFPTYADQRIQSSLAQYDASAAMLDAVVFSHQVRPALQGLAYDATGAMLNAVVFPTYADQQVNIPTSQGLAYDATGAMLDAVVFTHQVRPVSYPLWYDATGAMLEAVVFPKFPE